MNVNHIRKIVTVFPKQTRWRYRHFCCSSFSKVVPILATTIKSNSLLCASHQTKNFFKPLSAQASNRKDENQLSIKPITREQNAPSNSISRFYEDVNVLITGSTGYLGQVLVERLLSTCNPGDVYLLIRPKDGINVEHRTKQLFESPVFNKLKETSAEKVKVLYGDLEQPNMALGEADRHMILERVNIVLHSAANVRFVEKLQNIIITNTLGTKRIVELCKEIKHLKSFVHVSTVFRNKLEVDEVIYKPAYDPDFMIDFVQTMPADVIESIAPKLLNNHPNTYTLSKELAEKYVSDYSKFVPTAIVRPSMVNSSWKEPFPGWIDKVLSSTRVAISCFYGTLKILPCDEDIVADFIPVDVVADAIITAAWHTANYRSNNVKIYNCTSDQINRITVGETSKLFRRFSREYPTKHVVFYPGYVTTSNPTIFKIAHFLFHLVPAYIYDTYLYYNNHKPKTVERMRKTATLVDVASFSLFGNKTFRADKFKSLIEAVKKAEDGSKFNMDMSQGKGFEWETYMKDYVLGIRKHIFKDDISTLPYAKIKLNRIYWTTKAVQVASLGAALGFLMW